MPSWFSLKVWCGRRDIETKVIEFSSDKAMSSLEDQHFAGKDGMICFDEHAWVAKKQFGWE